MRKKQSSRFNQAATTYELSDTWQQICFDYLRPFLPHQVESLIDLGCGSGRQLLEISNRYPNCSLVAVDDSKQMLGQLQDKKPKNCRYIQANFDEAETFNQLPATQLVLANASLHWSHDLPLALQRIKSKIKEKGVFLATFFLPDTFFELQKLLQSSSLFEAVPASRFQDIASIKRSVGRDFNIQFSQKVTLKQIYPSLKHLLKHIKRTGVHEKKNTPLWTPRKFHDLQNNYVKQYGSIIATASFWVVYATT